MEDLLDLAVRSCRAWRRTSREERRDTLELCSVHEALLISNGAEEFELWDYPRAVAQRIVLDEGCREEARRRNHQIDPPLAVAVAQAKALQEFRAPLDQALGAIEDWAAFMAKARAKTDDPLAPH